MSQLEKMLRMAFRAKASQIPAGPLPLDAELRPVPDPLLGRRAGRVRRRGAMRWLIPVGAALAVLALTAAAPGHTVGVYSGAKYTPLPWPADAIGAAW